MSSISGGQSMTLSVEGSASAEHRPLRGALGVAADGDLVVFDIGGTFAVGSEIAIAHDVIILAPGATMVTLDGQGSTRVLSLSNGADVTLSGLTITRGKAPDSSGGGAILVKTGAKLSVADSVFSSNSAPDVGGGAIENKGTLIVSETTFSDNTAGGGGGIDNGGS